MQDFVGQATSRYAMDEIEYIMVDEAQDTPPQAFRILETFRDMGETVIITGDRNQAIFGFMRTESLFELIPSSQKVVHHLRTSRRCCPDVVAFLNDRFALGMKSAYPSALGPDVIESVCVQAQYNATLGRLYAKYLFTLDAVLKVSVSEGESTTKFWEAVHSETSRIYSTSLAKARDIVEHRQQALAQKHRLWAQTPRHWRLPMFVFSTVHHFKDPKFDVPYVTFKLRELYSSKGFGVQGAGQQTTLTWKHQKAVPPPSLPPQPPMSKKKFPSLLSSNETP